MNKFKPIVLLVFAMITSLAFIGVVYLIGALLFNGAGLIEPSDNESIEEWTHGYIKFAGWLGISITAFGAILWCPLAQWTYPVVKPEDAGKRGLWAGLFFFPLTGALVSLLVLVPHPVQSGIHWVVIFSILIPFLCYWLVTVLFSPISYKYTLSGASTIRPLVDKIMRF